MTRSVDLSDYPPVLTVEFFEPPSYEYWYNFGVKLMMSGQMESAIISLSKALEIQPDGAHALYNKACCYALQGNVELAIENLQQVINLSPDGLREEITADSDFDSIRDDERFQALIQDGSGSDREEREIED